MRISTQFASAVAALIVHADASTSRFKTYKLPGALVGPCDLVAGPDQALWGQGILDNIFFRLDPSTGDITTYPIPFPSALNKTIPTIPGVSQTLADRTALSCAIRLGDDGNIYAGNGLRNQLVRIKPTSKQIDLFDTAPYDPLGNGFPFNDLYSAKNGIWFTSTTANTFNFFSFATEKIQQYQVPTPLALPLGCYVNPQTGIVYIAELVANKILTYNPKTKVTKEFPLPELQQYPAVIRSQVGSDIFFSLFVGNGIGRISTTTNHISLYHTNQTGLLGSEDTVDANGGTWLSSFTTDVISRLDAATLEWSYVALPNTFAKAAHANGALGDIPPVVDIAVNYGPGNKVWFTSLTKNLVGSYDLDGLYG